MVILSLTIHLTRGKSAGTCEPEFLFIKMIILEWLKYSLMCRAKTNYTYQDITIASESQIESHLLCLWILSREWSESCYTSCLYFSSSRSRLYYWNGDFHIYYITELVTSLYTILLMVTSLWPVKDCKIQSYTRHIRSLIREGFLIL